jgi:hypothetical protein
MRNKGRQDITYWPKTGENKYGEESFGVPQLLKGRWEDRNEVVRLPSGEEIVSKSVVFLPTDVTTHGYLAQGDQTAEADPTQAEGREIQTVINVPSLRTNQMEHRAIL